MESGSSRITEDHGGHGESCPLSFSMCFHSLSIWALPMSSPAGLLRAPKSTKVDTDGPFKDSGPELALYHNRNILLIKTSHRSGPVGADKQGYECKDMNSSGLSLEVSCHCCSRCDKITAVFIPFYLGINCFSSHYHLDFSMHMKYAWTFPCLVDFNFPEDLHRVINCIWQIKKLRLREAK